VKKFKIAFLDRDGVINSSKPNNGYVGSLRHFKWIPGAIKAIKFLNDKNYKVVVISNQSGVARGFFTIKDVKTIHSYIQKKLKENQAKIDKFYFCPYHKDGVISRYKKKSALRKPNIGMFLLAKRKWNIDLKNSFMIGDQKTDIEFAKRVKLSGYLFNQKNIYKFIKSKIFCKYI
jgi:D-glycero-D-manno-heptose 1,7-bisphosphate phosphatase